MLLRRAQRGVSRGRRAGTARHDETCRRAGAWRHVTSASRTAEAEARAAGLRFSSDTAPGHLTPSLPDAASAIAPLAGARRERSERSRASAGSRSRRPGATCGSARTREATCRRPAATRAGASSTSTTPIGARTATRPSSTGWQPSARRCRGCAIGSTRDLGLTGLPRERVLAAVVRLVDDTLIRVGNDEYRRTNGSFGATTMQAEPRQGRGLPHRRRVPRQGRQAVRAPRSRIRRLARTLQRLHDLPGRELFEYRDADGAAAAGALRGRQRVSARRERGGLDRQGLPHVGRERTVHACARPHREHRTRRRRPTARPRRRFARSPMRSATPPRCAARRTSIRRCSTATQRGACRCRRSGACGVSTAGNPRCCGSCGRSEGAFASLCGLIR